MPLKSRSILAVTIITCFTLALPPISNALTPSASPTPAPSPYKAGYIWAGSYHNCLVTLKGALKCWGDNRAGQLGNNSTIDSLVPTDVYGLGSGTYEAAAGDSHTCVLTTAGGVKCWGGNAYGQLGDKTKTRRLKPVDVAGLQPADRVAKLGFASIGAGRFHSCVLTLDQGAKCWGSNYYGQLGNDSWNDSTTPVEVKNLAPKVSQVYSGETHSCILSTTGGGKCWGNNEYGQLGAGPGSLAEERSPIDVFGLTSGLRSIALGMGAQTCAVTASGGVKCWGEEFGQINKSPVDVPDLQSSIKMVAVGGRHKCALTDAGAVKCWGANWRGQLGNGTTTDSPVPVQVQGLESGVTAIALGKLHSCALINDGSVRCWGFNGSGTLGNNSRLDSAVPVVVNFSNVIIPD